MSGNVVESLTLWSYSNLWVDKAIVSKRLRIVSAFSPYSNSTVERDTVRVFSTVKCLALSNLLRRASTLLLLARIIIMHSLIPTRATQSCLRVKSLSASEKYKISEASMRAPWLTSVLPDLLKRMRISENFSLLRAVSAISCSSC